MSEFRKRSNECAIPALLDNGASKQMVLPLELPVHDWERDDFVIGLSNLSAFNAVAKPDVWADDRLMILGNPQSGKTTLANIWAKRSGAMFFNGLEGLQDAMPTACVIDGLEKAQSEVELFHAINHTMQHNIKLLITASEVPNFALPDLKSRIVATSKVIIHHPDEELIKALLIKKFASMQIEVDFSVIEYIITRLDRTFMSVFAIVESLNRYSIVHKKPITIHAVRSVWGI
jgi:chromosomal replication initiation ATPase DnaA